ncbi:hypothetical protein GYO_1508 [Bacillus spizizenii TU-B-10]|uniref:Uncharacterized protein n=1 Tax=Bacillus spizizenii (strain DSM 15029 / JCM 12233 / NBRC 101239 / NRRL B-23049 / TU-B-10) TaxID=1052585 RepID=G4NWK2_BACS4|nr:hypothetical protein GYO_1508 [Bacillus spizizenii TU-B-10]
MIMTHWFLLLGKLAIAYNGAVSRGVNPPLITCISLPSR